MTVLRATVDGPVAALAGRRIDAGDEGRFPLANVPLVRERLAALFEARSVRTVVASAACGSDLIALDVAGELGLERRVILPFEPHRFAETSVEDRPGEWRALYDEIIADVRRKDALVVLSGDGLEAPYAAANARILEEALRVGGVAVAKPAAEVPPEKAIAVIVWEGKTRGEGDATEEFAMSARGLGLHVEEILTS